MAEVTGTPAAEYLAGLWLGTLSHDLIFRREDAYESWDDMLSCLGSRDKYVVPSWSWASRGHLKSALVMTGKNSDMRDELREASAWTVPTDKSVRAGQRGDSEDDYQDLPDHDEHERVAAAVG